MPEYMLVYTFNDEDGKHFSALFANTSMQMYDVRMDLSCGLGAWVQVYAWDYDSKEYKFLEE